MTGNVKFFLPARLEDNRRSGFYGFVTCDGARPGEPLEFWFHGTSIVGGGPLARGAEVEFDLSDDPRHGDLIAVNVRLLPHEASEHPVPTKMLIHRDI